MKRHEPRIAAHEKDNQRPNPGKNQLQGVGQCCHGAFILRRFKATSAEAPRHFCNLQTSATYSTVASWTRAANCKFGKKLARQSRIAANCNLGASSDSSTQDFLEGKTLTTFYQDLRYALRQLRKSPVFTLTAVLTLALGIGANTAVFTLVHEVMLKSLPVADPGGLYRVGDKAECCIWGGFQEDWTIFSCPPSRYRQVHTPEFTEMAASQT